jgi:hypothetical protein
LRERLSAPHLALSCEASPAQLRIGALGSIVVPASACPFVARLLDTR